MRRELLVCATSCWEIRSKRFAVAADNIAAEFDPSARVCWKNLGMIVGLVADADTVVAIVAKGQSAVRNAL